MTQEQYISKLEAEKTAMLRTITGRANRDRNLRPRDEHPGYRVIAKREGYFDDVRNGVTQSRRVSFIVDIETPYPAEQLILPCKDTINQAILGFVASEAEYLSSEVPKLHSIKMAAPRGSPFWVATAYFSGEFTISDYSHNNLGG